jgi:hypothetical protein
MNLHATAPLGAEGAHSSALVPDTNLSLLYVVHTIKRFSFMPAADADGAAAGGDRHPGGVAHAGAGGADRH